MSFENGYLGFIDILGSKEIFRKDDIPEKDKLLTLLKSFAEHNGNYFALEPSVRVAALCFSDNIGFSIPANITTQENTAYYMHLTAFLHAASFFAYKTLYDGYLIRGALAYGPRYQENGVIMGKPLIEAVEHEKTAHYPRIILTPSFIKELTSSTTDHHFFGWDTKTTFEHFCLEKDQSDEIIFFDYLSYYKQNHDHGGEEGVKLLAELQIVLKRALANIEKKLNNTDDLSITSKLSWVKKYFQNFLQNIELEYPHREALYSQPASL